MNSKAVRSLILTCLCAGFAWAVDNSALDALTKLPVPTSGTAFSLYEGPMPLDDFAICKSTAKMNFYTPKTGKVDAAVAWYAHNLTGFKHTSGFGSGRSEDTFYNAAGTLIVSITGNPAKQGETSDVYAVTYGTLQPGVGEKVILGMNAHNIDCR